MRTEEPAAPSHVVATMIPALLLTMCCAGVQTQDYPPPKWTWHKGGKVSLSVRGRWAVITAFQHVRLFDLDVRPPREFTTATGIQRTISSGARFGAGERYVIGCEGQSTSVATRHIYRLDAEGQSPCLSLDASHQNLKASASGDCLVGVQTLKWDGRKSKLDAQSQVLFGVQTRNSGQQNTLCVWQFRPAQLADDRGRKLAVLLTSRYDGQAFWLGKQTDSLVALTNRGLLAWDLTQIDKGPALLSTGNPVLEVHGVRDEMSGGSYGPVWWRELTGHCYLTPIDALFGERPRLATLGRPVLYNGRFLAEELTTSYSLTDLGQDPPVKQTLAVKQKHSTIGNVLLGPKHGWALGTIVPAFDEAWTVKPDARLVSLDMQKTPIVLLGYSFGFRTGVWHWCLLRCVGATLVRLVQGGHRGQQR